jgi:hypothetical protein
MHKVIYYPNLTYLAMHGLSTCILASDLFFQSDRQSTSDKKN